MNAQDLLTHPIDSIDFKDRLRLIGALLDGAPIGHVTPTGETAIMVFACDDVKPGAMQSVRANSLCAFRPTRLVCLDSAREIVEHTTVEHRRWFRKPTYEYRENRRMVETPVSAWTVSGMWLGNLSALLAPAFPQPLPASAFETGRLFTDTLVNSGLTITLDVSHGLTTSANFRALLFGIRQK